MYDIHSYYIHIPTKYIKIYIYIATEWPDFDEDDDWPVTLGVPRVAIPIAPNSHGQALALRTHLQYKLQASRPQLNT